MAMSDVINRISYESEHYPPLLREITDAPLELYIRGDATLLHHPQLLAVVGSRKSSTYGQQALHQVVAPVVRAGVSLVSGLAFGIDGLAHKLCLDHQIPTIAVLGGGPDDASLYPKHHISLAHHIVAAGGAVISEYPPGTSALPHHFLARNRIIAGLCPATLVIQAAYRSGSLTTARLALDANRDVMAVPGNVTDVLSVGTNRLIQQGAACLTNGEDLLRYFNLEGINNPALQHDLSSTQQQICTLVKSNALHIDELIIQTGLAASDLSIILTELELLGVITNTGGMKYALTGGG